MNRNVHNTLMALSSAGLLLVVALIVAAPAAGNRGLAAGGAGDLDGAPPMVLAGTPGPVLVAAAHRAGQSASEDTPRRGSRRPDIRSAIALPYFSFAQGLRLGNGG